MLRKILATAILAGLALEAHGGTVLYNLTFRINKI